MYYIVNRQKLVQNYKLRWGWGMIEHKGMVSTVMKTVVNTVTVYNIGIIITF